MCANNLDTYSPEAKELESYINIALPNKLINYNTFKISRPLTVSHNKNHHCAVITC
jgi:hypothetical protein